MGKVFGIVLFVLAIWVGLTVYDQGVDRAFGGLFAGSKQEAPHRVAATTPAAPDDSESDEPEGSARPAPITERVRERVTGSMEQGARRAGGR
jgi:hypothetical protein